MSLKEKEAKKLQRDAKIAIWMATRSSRNKSFIDKACRCFINRATKLKAEDDFMRDSFVDNDMGFDPGELERFQRGEEVNGS